MRAIECILVLYLQGGVSHQNIAVPCLSAIWVLRQMTNLVGD